MGAKLGSATMHMHCLFFTPARNYSNTFSIFSARLKFIYIHMYMHCHFLAPIGAISYNGKIVAELLNSLYN